MLNDFVIVGGGVIGLMLARELSQAGAGVTLIERGACAQESSWAGGGIVSPLYPWRYSDPITALASLSQAAYPKLAAELLQETGIDPELRTEGALFLRVADQAEALAWAQAQGKRMQVVDKAFLYDREPEAAPHCESALWMPDTASIRNPRLGQALKRSLELNPRVRLLENTEIRALRIQDGEVLGVETAQAVFSARKVILATGAWTGQLLSDLGIHSQIQPVRGQMILFKAVPNLVRGVVLMDGRYVIPRADGRILAGSTLEYVGFDKQTCEEARLSLQETAYRIIPALADFPIEHHWAGLRPGSVDGIPWIGAVPGYQNLYINAGHFRNGLVLAPAAVRLLTETLLERPTSLDPAPYLPSARIQAAQP
ncbi:glycine oxidase [Allopseudospirillum japonicum]|uniref:Glycine oxidase n=1 Tax=Allopseudospirillum japonicum TaxID=64971 RepID=A0A1H6UF72_9GAMM|nr:glycine oxidase ThiO [Allopseudospirillum japonicum]SEI90971.1 glycine oxidase [Allopseudospirillum japonicum]